MSKKDSLTHFSTDDGLVWHTAAKRLKKVGYQHQLWGENIAQGYEYEEEVMAGWIKSPGHCRNIMFRSFTEMGVDKIGNYWTQILAIPETNKFKRKK